MYQEVFPVNTGRNEYNKCRRHHHDEAETAYFIRGTTPLFEFELYDDDGPLDLSDLIALEAYVSQETESGEAVVITKTIDDMEIDGGTLRFNLTQEETLQFESGDEPFPKYAFVQIRGLNSDEMVWATIAEEVVKVYRLTKEAVINA